jgi:hypothetical protein
MLSCRWWDIQAVLYHCHKLQAAPAQQSQQGRKHSKVASC